MKKTHKSEIRLFILDLLSTEEIRWKLDDLAASLDLDPFEAMEFFEQEVGRVEKLFSYPQEAQESSQG